MHMDQKDRKTVVIKAILTNENIEIIKQTYK